MGRKGGVALADPMSDLFTRIRNGQMARRASVSAPYSRFGLAVLELLVRHGYLRAVRVVPPPPSPRAPQFNTLEAFLKYDPHGQPAIGAITRTSKPSRRVYTPISRLPVPNGGLANWILTTPKGVLSCTEARAQNVGGEVIGIVQS